MLLLVSVCFGHARAHTQHIHTRAHTHDSSLGKYNTDAATAASEHDEASDCLSCSNGRVSVTDRTSCNDCEAGEYVYQELSCVDCEQGKYAPSAQKDQCLTCDAGNLH